MKLLALTVQFNGVIDVRKPKEERPIEFLQLALRDADILFDDDHTAVLAVSYLYSKSIVKAPGPEWDVPAGSTRPSLG